MAYDDEEYEDYGEEDISSLPVGEQAEYLYDLIGFKQDVPGDSYVRETFWDVMYNNDLPLNERIEKYNELSDYLYEEYGLEFEDVWDWEDFRDWYESA